MSAILKINAILVTVNTLKIHNFENIGKWFEPRGISYLFGAFDSGLTTL